MSTTSMSLETLRFLLQYMDANQRFEIYQRCPSIREFEKSVPLKINSLIFMPGCVRVNDTSYSINIIRKYNVGEVNPHLGLFENEIVFYYDVDRYGFKDFSDETRKTPGDVEINRPRMVQRIEMMNNDDEFRITVLENFIQNHETQLANRLERRPNANRNVIDQMRNTIAMLRERLLDYQYRRENTPPNYEHFLQLTISRTVDEQEQKTIQRYIHNKKYSDAVKQLTTVLLGGRSFPISVERMQLLCRQGVIRLPVGLKFKIKQLKFIGAVGTTLEAVAPIFHESSFPLKELDVGNLSAADVTNPIVVTAEKLRIRLITRNRWQVILAIKNPVVQVSKRLSKHIFEKFISTWIESERRPIGSEFIFDQYHEPHYANELEEILKRRFNGVAIDDENVIIPMNDAAHLKVSYGPFPEFAPCSRWAVRFSTEAIEH
ncbi:unnamed protein product [Caenorhabditis brenneri]